MMPEIFFLSTIILFLYLTCGLLAGKLAAIYWPDWEEPGYFFVVFLWPLFAPVLLVVKR